MCKKIDILVSALKEATCVIQDSEYGHYCNNYRKSDWVLKYEKIIQDITGEKFDSEEFDEEIL